MVCFTTKLNLALLLGHPIDMNFVAVTNFESSGDNSSVYVTS